MFTLRQEAEYVIGDEKTSVVVLEGTLENKPVQAVIAPALGFSLVSFTLAGVEIMCTKRTAEFNDIRKGMGVLIGPHFGGRKEFPTWTEEALAEWRHVPGILASNTPDVFLHGIARYAKWNSETLQAEDASSVSVKGTIRSSDAEKGLSYKDIEGFDFEMSVEYRLSSQGLQVSFDIQGEKPVTASTHFYYRVDDRAQSELIADVVPREDFLAANPGFTFQEGGEKSLHLPLTLNFGHAFDTLKKEISTVTYKNPEFSLDISFQTSGNPEETFESVTLFSPTGENFICIYPVSTVIANEPKKNIFRGKILLTPQLN